MKHIKCVHCGKSKYLVSYDNNVFDCEDCNKTFRIIFYKKEVE